MAKHRGLWRIDSGEKILFAEVNKLETINGKGPEDGSTDLRLDATTLPFFSIVEIADWRQQLESLSGEEKRALEAQIALTIRDKVDSLAGGLHNLNLELANTNLSLDEVNMVLWMRAGEPTEADGRTYPRLFRTAWLEFEATNPPVGTPYPFTFMDMVSRLDDLDTEVIKKSQIMDNPGQGTKTIMTALDVRLADNIIEVEQYFNKLSLDDGTPFSEQLKISGRGAVEITLESGTEVRPTELGIGVDLSDIEQDIEDIQNEYIRIDDITYDANSGYVNTNRKPIVTELHVEPEQNNIRLDLHTTFVDKTGGEKVNSFNIVTNNGIVATPNQERREIALSADVNGIQFKPGMTGFETVGGALETIVRNSYVEPDDPLLTWNRGNLKSEIRLDYTGGILKLFGRNDELISEENLSMGASLIYAQSHRFDGQRFEGLEGEYRDQIIAAARAANLRGKDGTNYLILGFADAAGVVQFTFTDLTDLIPIYKEGDGIKFTSEANGTEVSVRIPVTNASGLQFTGSAEIKKLAYVPKVITMAEFENLNSDPENNGIYYVED